MIPSTFVGVRLVESPWLTISQEQTVPRTRRERWLTWPWRPWVATKTVVVRVPNPELYRIAPGTLVGHPMTIRRLKAEIARRP